MTDMIKTCGVFKVGDEVVINVAKDHFGYVPESISRIKKILGKYVIVIETGEKFIVYPRDDKKAFFSNKKNSKHFPSKQAYIIKIEDALTFWKTSTREKLIELIDSYKKTVNEYFENEKMEKNKMTVEDYNEAIEFAKNAPAPMAVVTDTVSNKTAKTYVLIFSNFVITAILHTYIEPAWNKTFASWNYTFSGINKYGLVYGCQSEEFVFISKHLSWERAGINEPDVESYALGKLMKAANTFYMLKND